MPAHIDKIIEKLGYAQSSCLGYGRSGFVGTTLSAHHKRVLGELSPYAAYFIDSTPFMLFYEENADKEEQKRINRKIWNAQIPVTIVCGTGSIKVYNSCLIDREKSVFDEVTSIPADQIDENSPFSYWEITNHNFWTNYTAYFSGEKLNDYLLRNLSDITIRLRENYHIRFATKLILRLIFIRYLIDRGVDLDYTGFKSDIDVSRKRFLKLLSDKAELYNLFLHLKNKFNGNLFEMDTEADTSCLTTEVLQVLSDFFSANVETKTGQRSLFDLYDFNIIPVELISNIYEILLGKEGRDKDNAFYTPQYLVDYILDSSISPFIRDNGVCKVLDPSCGSGIFLVESYRRMVERELNGKPFADNDDLLQNILSENIYGVDLNEDAIDVAIFSLYLSVLDYKNPKTLKKFALPNLKGENLFVADFFDEVALNTLENFSFDFIVGNPPWGKGKETQKAYFKKHKLNKYNYRDDTCRAFILRAKNFCSARTQCCFVLHSKILYLKKDPSKRFREFLLKNTKISRIVELSSVRKLVFKSAEAPAVILSFSFSDDASLENRFEYISMKPNLFFSLFNIVVIEKNDIKYVQQKLLAENDWAWKTLVYGLSGDIDNILKLKSTFYILGDIIEQQSEGLIKGEGVQYHLGDKKPAHHLLGLPLLDSDTAIEHFILRENNSIEFDRPEIHRPREASLFNAPYCLVKRGLDMNDYTMRAVYSENDFVFKHAVFAIKGSKGNKDFLLNVTGLLNSKVYAYFNLMLGSDLGIEREQRHMGEVLTFPYVSRDDIVKQVWSIQELLKPEDFSVLNDASEEIEKLNSIILEAFNLSDNSFIDYALNVQIPQLTSSENHMGFQAVSTQQLCNYAKLFLEALSTVYDASDKYITANIYTKVTKYYSAIEIVLHDIKPSFEIQVVDDYTSTQAALTRFSTHKINDMFFTVKDVIHFEEDSFYIIKTNQYKNWHPAIAEIDLADFIDQILSRNGGTVDGRF